MMNLGTLSRQRIGRGIFAIAFGAAALCATPALAERTLDMAVGTTADRQGGTSLNSRTQEPAASSAPQRLQPVGGDIGPGADVTTGAGRIRMDQSAPSDTIRPFGAQLFGQAGVLASSHATNAAYILGTGDRIALNMWGAMSFQGIQTVDPEGNIFIPEVGPVAVAGQTADSLNARLVQAVRRVYTDNVHIYANVMTHQPIGVYVTGSVREPGRYPGAKTGSVLDFLIRAGGIDPHSGSYRDIRVVRGTTTLARIDLYEFLLSGTLPDLTLRENDAIVVGPRGTSVIAKGDVANAYRFEINIQGATGQTLMSIARPEPMVSFVAIRGTRGGRPHNAYIPAQTFRTMALHDGDEYTFISDGVSSTIFVSISGEHTGPSSFAVPRGARLGDVLKLISVDPQQVALDDIYLRRESVAERQARALEVALNELQRTVLTTPAVSSTDAEVRAREAELVERFVQQARVIEPEGRVVLAGAMERDQTRLEPNDEIVIPSRSNVVLVSGEVRMPQSVLYRDQLSPEGYVELAGGFTERGNHSDFVVIRRSGLVEVGTGMSIQPGDHIMVMPEADSSSFAIFKDVVEILYRVAVSSAVVLNIND